MTTNTVILLPQKQGTKFNKKYFLDTHIPLIHAKLEKYGLRTTHVTEFAPKSDNLPAEFHVMTTLIWKSQDQMMAAMASTDVPLVISDTPNFYTGAEPIIMTGLEIVK